MPTPEASSKAVTIVRPRTVLGHGRLGVMALLFEFVADGAPVFVLGGGNNRYQLVHAADLADAINALMADPALRDRMGAAGRRRAIEEFSWSSIAERTVALYDRLLGSASIPAP